MTKVAEEGMIKGALVTGNYTFTATMPNGKTVNVSGYLYDGESKESVIDRMNIINEVIDHQRTRAEIPELEAKLEGSIRRLDEIRAHYAVLLGKQERGQKVTAQEKQALEVMDINVKKHLDDIEKGRQAILDAKTSVGLA